jgi:hypothetical protein
VVKVILFNNQFFLIVKDNNYYHTTTNLIMGGAVSTTDIENRVKTALGVDVTNQIENVCSVLSDTSQKLVITGISGGTIENITQESFVENTCKISSAIEALQDIEGTQELIQELQKSQDTSGLFAINVDTTNIMNEMETEIDISVLNAIKNECKAQFTAPQFLEISDSSDIHVKNLLQTNKMYNDCIQGSDVFQEVKAKVESDVKSKAVVAQKTVGLDIGGILGAAMIPLMIGGAIFLVLFSTGSTKIGGRKMPDGSKVGGFPIAMVLIGLVVLVGGGIVVKMYMDGSFEKKQEEFGGSGIHTPPTYAKW